MQQFLNLPNPIKAVLAALTGTSIAGAVAIVDPKLAGIIFFGMVLLAMATAAFFMIRGWLRSKHAQSMTSELTQHSSAAPAGVNDAARRARLDDMRRTFGEGLAKFGSAENIYKFPWFLIVGEPGSGKTEAIRHSNVGFPPGLQNELQGVGGTINMNWWFSNQAVFLDTAGRLMFEEVKPGETNEWKEFLQLLSRNRPNCPINGLLLIIPADALIKDTEGKMNEKAGKIAQQFDVIQRALDIRFPAFVVITKCDLLSGFREFFDDFADAQSVNQMLGWSNPEDRDAPFEPARVTDHIATVVSRIKKRRFSLLRDPVPAKGEERRIDEVDALYSLPQSIQLIAPRLRQYLEKIFVAGPWSPKPLFLRGIYFTSSMREGAALDQELALALGLSPEQLPETGTWEKERAYFLRDIFTEKVFREKGLVTRATNTRKMLRKRSLVLWGTAISLALLAVGFTIYGYRQFADSIKRHSDLWHVAKNPADWQDGRWKPIVTPVEPGSAVSQFKGADIVLPEKQLTLLGYHDQLTDVATQPIETGFVYRPILKAAKLDDDRLKAQRIVFEASAVYPVVQAARHRMVNEPIATAEDARDELSERFDREANAVVALLRIEADQVTPGGTAVEELPGRIFEPLLRFSTARNSPADDASLTSFRSAFAFTYGKNPSGKWVPQRLAIGSGSLADNPPIQAGIGRLRTLAGETVRSQLDSIAKITRLRDDLREFREIETSMDEIASVGGSETETKLRAKLGRLTELRNAIDAKLKAEGDAGLFADGKVSMFRAYQQMVSASQSKADGNFKLIQDAVKPYVAHPTAGLFKQVDTALAETGENLKKQVAQSFDEKERADLERLDLYLNQLGGGARIYALRHDAYTKAASLAEEKDATSNLIGKRWEPYLVVQKSIEEERTRLPDLQAKVAPPNTEAPPIAGTCRAFLKLAEERRLSAILNAYLQQTTEQFSANVWFPYVSAERGARGNEAKIAADLLARWKADLTGSDFQKVAGRAKDKLAAFAGDIDPMRAAYNTHAAYQEKMAGLSVTISVTDTGQLKYRSVSGAGSTANIWGGQRFEARSRYGGTVTLTFTDDVNARRDSTTIDTRNLGSRRISLKDDTVTVNVQLQGEVPQKPPAPPSKAEILAKLR